MVSYAPSAERRRCDSWKEEDLNYSSVCVCINDSPAGDAGLTHTHIHKSTAAERKEEREKSATDGDSRPKRRSSESSSWSETGLQERRVASPSPQQRNKQVPKGSQRARSVCSGRNSPIIMAAPLPTPQSQRGGGALITG